MVRVREQHPQGRAGTHAHQHQAPPVARHPAGTQQRERRYVRTADIILTSRATLAVLSGRPSITSA